MAIALVSAPQKAWADSVCDDSPPPQQTALPRPIPLGISGGNIHSLLRRHDNHKVKGCFSGTLGSMVQDSSETQYILSNNHVLAHQNKAKPGEPVIQPGLVDLSCLKSRSDAVATFSRTIDIKFGVGTNVVDAAIAQVVPGQVSPEIFLIGGIAGTPATPTIGRAVKKMGRTTCFTSGVIAALDANVTVNYSDGIKPKLAKFVNQILVKGDTFTPTFGGPGDSGSLIVTQDTCPQAAGLLFAGSADQTITIANPIDKVLSKLNVSMVGTCNDAAASDAAPAASGSDIGISEAFVASASAVRDRHENELMSIAGAVGTGIAASDQAGKPAIEVYLNKTTPEAQAAAPKTVDGVPVRLVQSGEFVAY